LTHDPSHHVAADTSPVRAAVSDSFRSALVAFARYRPSQPPEKRVTRLHLRRLVRYNLTRLRLRPSRHVLVALHTKFDSFVKISGTQGFLTRLRLRPSRHVFVALHTKFDSFVKISGIQGFLVRCSTPKVYGVGGLHRLAPPWRVNSRSTSAAQTLTN
jgi:hypothetical protein